LPILPVQRWFCIFIRRTVPQGARPKPVSDPNHEIVQAYQIWAEKSMHGKKYMGTERTTFLIGPDRRIKAILKKLKPAEHVTQLLKALAS
jgi:peroxiredoxin